jgi:hypothetical protein
MPGAVMIELERLIATCQPFAEMIEPLSIGPPEEIWLRIAEPQDEWRTLQECDPELPALASVAEVGLH